MIRRSTLVFLTCLGALSVSVIPVKGAASANGIARPASAPLVVAQAVENAASSVLSLGTEGQAVRALQDRLKNTEYYDGPVDGVYGLATQRAVTDFQKAKGFDQTGRLDNDTWAALQALDPSAESPSAESPSAESSADGLEVSDTSDADAPTPAADLPPIGEDSDELSPVGASAGESARGYGRVLGLGLGLAALVASFGVGFFIANRGKAEAEADADDEWGPVGIQPSVSNGVPTGTSNGSSNGIGSVVLPPRGIEQGPTVTPAFGSTSALAAVTSATQKNGQLGGTSPLASTEVVDSLVKDLHNPDPSQRRKIIWELGQRGNSMAVQPLVDIMVTADSKEKSLVLAALSEIGQRSLKPMNRALAIALQDENPEVRKNAIRDITRVYELVIQISQMLGHATEDEDPEVRQTATWALDQLNRLRRTQDIDTNMRSFTSGGNGPNRFAS